MEVTNISLEPKSNCGTLVCLVHITFDDLITIRDWELHRFNFNKEYLLDPPRYGSSDMQSLVVSWNVGFRRGATDFWLNLCKKVVSDYKNLQQYTDTEALEDIYEIPVML